VQRLDDLQHRQRLHLLPATGKSGRLKTGKSVLKMLANVNSVFEG
jgi:hypothetical protein